MPLRCATLLFTAAIFFAASYSLSAQSAPPPSPAQTTSQPCAAVNSEKGAGAGVGVERSTRLREGFKAIAEGSRELNGWSLALIGASVLTIISTSYYRPFNRRVRVAYLLFVPSWVLFAISIYEGAMITRYYMSAALGKDEILDCFTVPISRSYGSQIFYLELALLFFSMWLVIFLLWWIFGAHPAAENKNM